MSEKDALVTQDGAPIVDYRAARTALTFAESMGILHLRVWGYFDYAAGAAYLGIGIYQLFIYHAGDNHLDIFMALCLIFWGMGCCWSAAQIKRRQMNGAIVALLMASLIEIGWSVFTFIIIFPNFSDLSDFWGLNWVDMGMLLAFLAVGLLVGLLLVNLMVILYQHWRVNGK